MHHNRLTAHAIDVFIPLNAIACRNGNFLKLSRVWLGLHMHDCASITVLLNRAL